MIPTGLGAIMGIWMMIFPFEESVSPARTKQIVFTLDVGRFFLNSKKNRQTVYNQGRSSRCLGYI